MASHGKGVSGRVMGGEAWGGREILGRGLVGWAIWERGSLKSRMGRSWEEGFGVGRGGGLSNKHFSKSHPMS